MLLHYQLEFRRFLQLRGGRTKVLSKGFSHLSSDTFCNESLFLFFELLTIGLLSLCDHDAKIWHRTGGFVTFCMLGSVSVRYRWK